MCHRDGRGPVPGRPDWRDGRTVPRHRHRPNRSVSGVDGFLHLTWTVLVTAFLCIPIGLSLWALLDAARRPAWAWPLADRNQAIWMALILVGFFSVVAVSVK